MSVKLLRANTAEQFSGKIKLSLDSKAYTSKPAGAEIGAIRNRLSGQAAAAALDIPTLAREISSGKTIQGAILRDKQSENDTDTDKRYLQQQLFNVDIDNDIKNENGDKVKSSTAIETPEQIQSIAAAAGLTPCYIAESFSSGKKDVNGAIIPKYHVGFAAAEPVKDVNQSRRILLNLLSVFKSADEACKDPARIIFGTGQSKQVYYNSAVNSIETLLTCGELPEEPEQKQLPSSEPAPKAKHTQSTAPKASGKSGVMSDFTRDLKENKADPDRLLYMINPNNIDYEKWRRAVGSYTHFDGATIDNFDTWNRQYTGSDSRKLKQDLKAYKALGKGVDKMSLHYIAEEQNPEEYNNYMQELISLYKPARASRKQASPADPAGAHSAESSTQAEQVEQWQEIKPFEKAVDLQPFPLETLPKVLQDYVKAAAAYNSVFPEMCILPLFSALSLSLQGKAVVKHPGTGYKEPLNLYCITIAAPGERKTATSDLFFNPIKDFERRYNTIHGSEIEEYRLKHKILENRLNKAIQRGKPEDEQEALKLRADLSELEKDQKNPLNYTLQDVTPEALIDTLNENQERAAIIGDEATLFKILCGAYNSKGSAGVNFDILLCCYDGSQYKVSRKNSGNIYLNSPLVTIGTMIQPQPFKQVLQNSDLSGKGLLQRFIFSNPRSNVGNIPFTAPQIPSKTAAAYKDLIYKLLELPQLPQSPEIGFDKEATSIIEYYHYELQKKQKPGGVFSDLTEYASKHEAKVLRIAALLHLCEHSAGELINGYTAMQAVKIGTWLESQATAALEAEMMTDTERNARYILRKLIDYAKAAQGEIEALTKRDITRMCRKLKGEDMQEALAYLDDMGVLKYQEEKTKGRPCMKVILNPNITDFVF